MNKNFGNNYAFKKAAEGLNCETEVATRRGVGIKTTLLVFITFLAAVGMIVNLWRLQNIGSAMFIYLAVVLANFVFQIIIFFKPLATKALSIPYAICEGLSLGVIVGLLELALPGQGLQLAGLALIITVSIFLAASILYTTGVIQPGHRFRSFMFATLLGITIVSLVTGIIWIFAPGVMSALYSSTLGLVISVILVIFAGLYVVISIDNANRMVDAGLSKDYEWLASYGILINVVWLFLEVLRLLIILLDRRN